MITGHGAVQNANGEVELDAIIMDGQTLGSGAVSCVQNIANPVSLARAVMEKVPPFEIYTYSILYIYSRCLALGLYEEAKRQLQPVVAEGMGEKDSNIASAAGHWGLIISSAWRAIIY